ncbi:DNA repair protein complementing XP-C cells [Osmerus eperlanus]|uniref:DNA repair protein complementing XP-C cells n=1 Tax=Osmerus eperlanus TaxID=29151 RepID=UPI002E14028F
MAKRKVAAETLDKTDTKKLKQVSRGKAGGTRGKVKKDPENEEEEEVEVKRKAKSVPRIPRPAANHVTKKTSKYFLDKSPTKVSEDDDDDIPDLAKGTAVVLQPVKEKEDEEEDSEEEEDWEEVEELSEPLGPTAPAEPALPSQPVEIEIETPDLIHKRLKREKKKAEFETYLRRMVNRFNKDVVEDTHKVHLMCLLANGMFRNRLCREPDLLAITLSLLPSHFTMVTTERRDQNYLSGLLKWFGATFTLTPELPCEERPDPRAVLERRLGSLTVRDHQEMTHLFLLVLRSLQFFCRLVISLQPLSMKPPATKGKAKSSPPGKSPPEKPPKTIPPSDTKPSPGTKRSATGGSGGRGGKKPKKEASTGVKEEEDGKKERTTVGGGQKPKNSTRRSVASKVSYKEQSSEGEGPSEGEEFQLTSEGESEDSEGGARRGKPGKGKGKTPARRRSGGRRNAKCEGDDEDCEEEEEEEEEEEGAGKAKGAKQGRRKNKGPGADEWLEVYLDKTGSWVCVDVCQGVGQPQLCSQSATQPLTYVAAVDDEGNLKDLSRKYDPNWMTSSRKRRVDEEWWEETLEPFLGEETERDLQEDKELQARLLDRPLPTSVAEFKNHPLYALDRHLLKYEALYPPTATILGYCRGEPVYSRDCIHTLHSRDTWLKEARTVRLGEEPYKMVRGFSNRSRKARMMSEEKDKNDLPLFGDWQTEEYQPPIAVDGRVPRNDYGNVYLFKPCMLPVGCVHLRLPNLHRVAKKLEMDCASAITGFDFHGGYSHAVTDGYIVCEEHEEILRAAWVEDQEIQKQKEKEKREKRAVSNWTLLVKGLLIKERLKRRYGHQGPKDGGGLGQANSQDREGKAGLSSDEEEEDGGEASGPASQTAAVTFAQSWPQNRQEEQDQGSASGAKKSTTKREKRGQQKHMFPFEKV